MILCTYYIRRENINKKPFTKSTKTPSVNEFNFDQNLLADDIKIPTVNTKELCPQIVSRGKRLVVVVITVSS